jgi:catechol 2,3-dioxygenase-like lactoylglutathione lyase family enzyme
MTTREAVTGIGGIFFKARDPKALAAWYLEHLGVPVFPSTTYATFKADEHGRDGAGLPLETAWSTFPVDTEYFGENSGSAMINYRVRDLDAMLAQLRAAGVWVADRVDDSEFGKFSWAADPEGNRFELWQPPAQ